MEHETISFLNNKFIGSSFTGSRATGLLSAVLAALKTNNMDKTKVLLPAITCTSVVHAVLAANLEPIFVDVVESDFNSKIDNYTATLDEQSCETLAVIGIHQYGHFNDMSKLKELLMTLRIPLVEDACLFFDSPGYEPLGDFLLNSFGHNKPVEAGAGAAITLRNGSLEIDFKYSQKIATKEVEDAYINSWYKNQRKGHMEDITSDYLIFEKYRDYLLYGAATPDWNLVEKRLALHETIASKRREKWNLFADALKDSNNIQIPKIDVRASNPWRFTFTLNKEINRSDFTDKLRKEIVHASNWYSSLSLSYPNFQGETPVADSIGNGVVNLWINDKCSDEYMARAITFIERY
jgi:dTDP-4-amino-4,6-dideoxygalactose transaminase